MSDRYKQSEAFLKKVEKIIPLGSQTFSKSKTQFPYGVAPYFIEKGLGAKVWDLDGNEYTDFVNGLLSISLGYQDPDVDAAVKKQLKNGVSFSLPHRLEYELAEKIIDMVPCAEMVRYGKNGSDATAGAIRVARAYTGRDHVATCGYHGWQDWSIGATTRNLGVPEATSQLAHTFKYNDIASLEAIFAKHPKQIAAVIMEPMNVEFPKDNFLQKVKELAHKHGAIFIFDEMITGFRFAKGGAQEYFGVTPDLATFGKGVANGYPLSIVAGKQELMKLMEAVFFSFTFGGETLSLAAANAVVDKMNQQPVIEHLATMGQKAEVGIKQLIQKHGLQHCLDIVGHPSWTILSFKDTEHYSLWEIKTLWLQEVLARGILTFGSHNISYAHIALDLERLLTVYDEVFAIVASALTSHMLKEQLKCEPLQPLFSVR